MYNPDAIGDKRTSAILKAVVDRAPKKIHTSDLLATAIGSGDQKVHATLAQALRPGSSPMNVLEIINIYNEPGTPSLDFDGTRKYFSQEALEALDQFDAEFSADNGRDAALELLMSCVLSHPDSMDMEFLCIIDEKSENILNHKLAAELFRKRYDDSIKVLNPLFDSTTNRLRSDEFTESAWGMMESAGIRASELGYDVILPPHIFLALLGETEGVTERIVRLQAHPEIGPGKVMDSVVEAFRLVVQKKDAIQLTRDGFGEAAVQMLTIAQKAARLWGEERIDTLHLLSALLEVMPPRLASVLERSPISMSLDKMRRHIDQELRETNKHAKREIAFRLPAGLLPSEDLTYQANTGNMTAALHLDAYFENMMKALYRRRNNNLLITGLRGVGKTTLVWELARRSAAGNIPFLKRKRFLWVDCTGVAPGESKEKMNKILTYVSSRTDLILCIDGLGPLLRTEGGGNNKILLRNALKENKIRLIGVMSSWDYEDLISSDHELLEYFTRVSLEEPKKDHAVDIVGASGAVLAKDYKVAIDPKAVERAVILSSDYIMNERLPMKAIKILQRICEDIDYERTQKMSERNTVTAADVIKVVSDISGVPESTLSGIGEKDADYEKNLAREVIGQDEAVKAVATELKLIKAGLVEPGKPASVMFFAGLTGTGKTELAKTLAKFYSSSKRLQVYTMGNFTESHTISGIIGVPPGYVGHEQGGKLINDLNSDPYCVFLLDESEKAHPDVWKPFLNLFDEGWIVDSRGIKAFADRAIFILTSNAGQKEISDMTQAGASNEEITEKVRGVLTTIPSGKTAQPVFSPEFMARIKRIIIFKPLDEEAMGGICRKMVDRMQRTWLEKREKRIIVPDTLIDYIARHGHELDERSGYKEGGRIIRKLLSELVEVSIQNEAGLRESEYKSCNVIELTFMPLSISLPRQKELTPQVMVEFRNEKPPTPFECTAGAVESFRQSISMNGDVASMKVMASDQMERLDKALQRWAIEHPGEPSGVPDGALEYFQKASTDLKLVSSTSEERSKAIIKELVSALENGGQA
jgi:ATP-dependent Clp protease ATP-binding subunit ClpA